MLGPLRTLVGQMLSSRSRVYGRQQSAGVPVIGAPGSPSPSRERVTWWMPSAYCVVSGRRSQSVGRTLLTADIWSGGRASRCIRPRIYPVILCVCERLRAPFEIRPQQSTPR
jgi:hypothetical protein